MAYGALDELKLRPPRIPLDSLPRRALGARIGVLADRDFLIVSAPAGFGKSTALGSWAADLADTPAWISLGDEDGTFQALYPLVVRALASADPGRRDDYERIEAAAREAAASTDAPRIAAASLARVLASSGSPVRLVLDDFHRCPDRDAGRFLLTLSDLAAPRLKLVVSGRREPDLPLAKLRAEGRLGEIRARDLRFDPEETRDFVPVLRQASAGSTELEAVESRIEGWPAGLRLLKVSLEDRADPAAFIARLGASRRFILDYLIEEVLAGLEPELTDFLFRTAIAEPFTAELAALLLGGQDAAARAESFIRRVGAENLFLVGLDASGTWFRYHHLFGDLLRMRAPSALGRLEPALRKTASAWFDARGLPVYACRELLDGGYVEEAFGYLVGASREMYVTGRIPEILGLYDRLPFEAFGSHPDAAVWYSWFLATMGRGARVPTLLSWAEEAAPGMAEAGGETRVRGGVAMIRGLLALRAGDFKAAAALEAAAARLNEGRPSRDRAVTGYLYGLSLAGLGDAEGAELAFVRSEALAASAGDGYTQGMALCELSRVVAAAGRREEALGLLARAEAIGARKEGGPELWVGLAYVYEARILASLGRREEALDRGRLGLELSLDRGYPPPIALGRKLLFDLRLSAGELGAARDQLAGLRELAAATGMRSALDSCAEAEASLRLAEAAESGRAPASEPRPALKPASAEGEPQAAARVGPAGPLSARELEVLSMVADGMTNQEIADALFLSLGTVKSHVHHIADKLGSTNRTETVALARELGLLPA